MNRHHDWKLHSVRALYMGASSRAVLTCCWHVLGYCGVCKRGKWALAQPGLGRQGVTHAICHPITDCY